MTKKQHVLYLGANGFPFGSAVIQRQIQMSKALIEAGFDVTVISQRSTHAKQTAIREKIRHHGHYEAIEYYYASLTPYKPTNFLIRNTVKLLGKIVEPLLILYYRIFKNSRYIFNNSTHLGDLKWYYRLSRTFGMELIYDYVEFVDSLGNRDKVRIEDAKKGFDYQFFNHTDKVIVISKFLEDHLTTIAPEKTHLKVPPIINFSFFDAVENASTERSYFLFCGSAAYLDIIKFIINSYARSKSYKDQIELKLIIGGSPQEIKGIKNYIDDIEEVKNNIEIRSNIPYNELVSLYKSAVALLIPITNNLQDQARFPFKICEYLASKRPIITSDSGVITEFFEDGNNAFIAEVNSIEDFGSKMKRVSDQPEIANEVGIKGYELGKSTFNYKMYSDKLNLFLK